VEVLAMKTSNTLKNTFRRLMTACAMTCLLMAVACGDEPAPDADTGETDTSMPDIIISSDINFDVSPDQVGNDTVNDEGPVDTYVDPGQPELPPDEDPPYVVATYPANEETDVPIPFEIRVTFNEEIRFDVTVNKNTFKVFNMHDEEIPGTLAWDPVSFTVTFTPAETATFLKLSPYRVWLSEMIQDRAGNRMDEYNFGFATTGPEKMESYLPVAIKYAPRIYQATTQGAPQWDYPTAFNFDGDWAGVNNVDNWTAATQAPIWVYYDVIETYTHYYIRYHYFYPRQTEEGAGFGNQVSGVMVVVQKDPELPIAVETYFGTTDYQDIRSFVTQESGLVKDDDSDGDFNEHRKNYNVNWVFPQDQLFPGGHFQNYITTKSHESCAWIQTNKEDSMDFRCVLSVADKSTLKIMHFSYTDGTAGTVKAPFPYSNQEGSEVGYGLRLLINDWWVRRDATGVQGVFGSLLEFNAPDGLAGDGLMLPATFKGSPSASQSGGKTPWNWTWEPAVMNAYNYYVEFDPGVIYVHPAYYFARRHRLTLSPDTTGYSGAYCYNPYLFVDQRGQSADCLSLN